LKRKLLIQQQASTSSETELVQKQQKAEYAKQYRLKRKLLMQQRASTSSETESAPSKRRYGGAYEEDDEIFDFVVVQPNKNMNVHLPSLVMKVPDHLYVLGDTYTCHMLIN
jgi:hypothetical protein